LWVYIFVLHVVPTVPKRWRRQKAWFESEREKLCSQGKRCKNVWCWGTKTTKLNIMWLLWCFYSLITRFLGWKYGIVISSNAESHFKREVLNPVLKGRYWIPLPSEWRGWDFARHEMICILSFQQNFWCLKNNNISVVILNLYTPKYSLFKPNQFPF